MSHTMSTLALAALLACACTTGSATRTSRQGQCVVPPGAAIVTPIWQRTIACESGIESIGSNAEYDAACPYPFNRRDTSGVDLPTIDFSTQRLILIRGDSAEINFVADDGTALHLGLLEVSRGSPLPNVALTLPRTDHPLQIDDCADVCEGDCPQIP